MAWLLWLDELVAGARVRVWDHLRQAGGGRWLPLLLDEYGRPTREVPLAELLRELAERGENVVVVGWPLPLSLQPARLLLRALEERGALTQWDYSEWVRGRCPASR